MLAWLFSLSLSLSCARGFSFGTAPDFSTGIAGNRVALVLWEKLFLNEILKWWWWWYDAIVLTGNCRGSFGQ